jgi:hypothetical protein
LRKKIWRAGSNKQAEEEQNQLKEKQMLRAAKQLGNVRGLVAVPRLSQKSAEIQTLCKVDVAKTPWSQDPPLHNRWHPEIPAIATVDPGEHSGSSVFLSSS